MDKKQVPPPIGPEATALIEGSIKLIEERAHAAPGEPESKRRALAYAFAHAAARNGIDLGVAAAVEHARQLGDRVLELEARLVGSTPTDHPWPETAVRTRRDRQTIPIENVPTPSGDLSPFDHAVASYTESPRGPVWSVAVRCHARISSPRETAERVRGIVIAMLTPPPDSVTEEVIRAAVEVPGVLALIDILPDRHVEIELVPAMTV